MRCGKEEENEAKVRGEKRRGDEERKGRRRGKRERERERESRERRKGCGALCGRIP